MAETGTPDERFAAAQRAIAAIPGWLTDGQARLLFDAAARTSPGQRIVEIGELLGPLDDRPLPGRAAGRRGRRDRPVSAT